MRIVLVCIDALRTDHLGCYAGTGRGTPHMDRLAAEGIRFTNAISQAPWTHPSVASMLTGLYPSQHVMAGVRRGDDGSAKAIALSTDLPSLPGCLRSAGFATAAFVAGNAYLKPEFGLTRDFDHLDWRTTTDGTGVVEGFAAWLGATGEVPSFAYLHLMDVHSPLPPDLYPSRPMVDRGVDVAAGAEALDTLLGYYTAGVERADAHVGRILSLLEGQGLLDDTWVILTADHGEELNEHGVVLSHGQSLWRQLVWVPLLVRLPGARGAGGTATGSVSLIDLMPTILEAAGVPTPDVPGRSLLPVFRGIGGGVNGHGPVPEPGGGPAFSELLKPVRYCRSVTTDEYQLIETFHVSKMPPATVDDLAPGVAVEVKGQPLGSGGFLPTKVTVGIPGLDKLLGPVEAVDVPGGYVTIMGSTFHVDAGTKVIGLDKTPFALSDLSAGDRLNVTLEASSGGPRRAREVMWRKPGGESKLEGPVETVEAASDGSVTIRVLGRAVRIHPEQVRLVHRDPDARRWRREDVLAMVAAGDYVARERELYRFSVDPLEEQNLVESEPDIVDELAQRLATWAEATSGVRAPGEPVALDPESIEQLRRLGYLA